MAFSKWTKPGIYGALASTTAGSVLGFTWGGWMTDNSAETIAGCIISEEVALAMVPVCLKQHASGVGHRDALMEAGSATRPSSNTPDRDLADVS